MKIKAYLLKFAFTFIVLPAYSYIIEDLNQFLNLQECIHCDLTRSVIKFKTPLTPIHIDESYLTNAKIQASDFSHANLANSHLMRILIAHSNFYESWFESLQFEYSTIEDVMMKETHFVNVNWNHSQFINTQFQNSYFDQISFNGSDLRFTEWSDCHFKNTDFEQSDLRGVDFHGTQFENTRFKHADLRKANLYNTNITQQQLDEALSYVCAILPDGKIYDQQGKETC